MQRRRFLLVGIVWGGSLIAACIVGGLWGWSMQSSGKTPERISQRASEPEPSGAGAQHVTDLREAPADERTERTELAVALAAEQHAFDFNALPFVGVFDMEPWGDPVAPPPAAVEVISHYQAMRRDIDHLLGMRQLDLDSYLQDDENLAVLRATCGQPWDQDFLQVTVLFHTKGLAVDTLFYPDDVRARAGIMMESPRHAADALQVARTHYNTQVYYFMRRTLEGQGIDVLPSMWAKAKGRRVPDERRIPLPEKPVPLWVHVGTGGYPIALPNNWDFQIVSRASGGGKWKHSFKTQSPFRGRDPRYIRLLLAVARVSPTLSARTDLPAPWRANDPEPMKSQTLGALEWSARPVDKVDGSASVILQGRKQQ